jgi:hypothetical protein
LVSELFSAAIRVLNWMMKRSISVLAVIMLLYVVFKAVITIVDFMKWRVAKGVQLVNPVSETYPFTEKAILV